MNHFHYVGSYLKDFNRKQFRLTTYWTLYKPQNQKECDETIRLILLKQNT